MATGTTLDLLGRLTRASSDLSVSPPAAPVSSQLTIFYSGAVNVYNDVPADKAHAIMLLLANGDKQQQNSSTDVTPLPGGSTTFGASSMTSPAPISRIPVGTSSIFKQPFSRPSTPPLPSSPFQTSQAERKPHLISKRTQAELPFARKASLARFLEKRKDRVQAKVAGASEEEFPGHASKMLKTGDNDTVPSE